MLVGTDSRTHVPAGHLVLLQSVISVSRLLTDDRRRTRLQGGPGGRPPQ